jgi:hypothetical protein
MDFAAPATMRVFQAGLSKDGRELYDEWINVGSDHYRNAGLWTHPPESTTSVLDEFLPINKYIRLLETSKPAEAVQLRWTPQGTLYNLLRFEVGDLETMSPYFDPGSHGEVSLWVDTSTHWIDKAEITWMDSEGRRVEIVQTFAGFNDELDIQPPPSDILYFQ